MEGIESHLVKPSGVLATSYSERPEAPKHVWDWQAYSTWRDVIWELIGNVVDEGVRRAFLASPPEYVVCDDLGWLDDIVWSVRGDEVDTKSLLTDRLSQRFKAFRAVHGTRTSDLASFYAKGLLPLNPDAIHERARTIFLEGDFPELNHEKVENAIREVGLDIDGNGER